MRWRPPGRAATGSRVNEASIESLGDQALLLHLGDNIGVATSRQVHEITNRILERRPSWLLDCVPAYASLAVFIDATQFSDHDDPLNEARVWLLSLLRQEEPVRPPHDARILEVPVCYGGEFGPDLDEAAAITGLPADTLIARHCAPEYTVAMLGFAPGFPFLIGLDPALAMPRLSSPRTRVPGGSVAIGGRQTGIYPRESPGGWRILGRTPLTLFDPEHDPPALLSPGDRLRFVAIEAQAFARQLAQR